jgi:hypothetical protein
MQIVGIPLLLLGTLRPVLCGEPLDKSVTTRADHEVAMAEANAITSKVAFGEATLHEMVGKADDSLQAAEDAYELSRDAVPMSKQAATRARVHAYNTEKAQKDAESVPPSMKTMASVAAKAAAAAIMAQLKQEAIAEAEKRGADDAANWAARKDQMAVGAVAGAAMPYHLAILRAQKAAAQYKTRADSTIEGAKKLVNAAQQAAATSQVLQSAGKFVEAREYMMNAHAMMNDAVKMQGWASKFQATAGKVGGTITNGANGFAEQMGMIAANIAATFGTDSPMSLPGALLQKDSKSIASKESKSSLRKHSTMAGSQSDSSNSLAADDLTNFQSMMDNYKAMEAKANELQSEYTTVKEVDNLLSAKKSTA